MASLKLIKKVSTDDWHWVDHSLKSKLSCPTVGFEWEVPRPKDESLYTFINTSPACKFFEDKYRMRLHADGYAVELTSPPCHTLSQVRSVAKQMVKEVRNTKLQGRKTCHNSGIHVTVGFPNRVPRGYTIRKHQLVAIAILNRESSAKFLKDFSGRGGTPGGYGIQATATCWDTWTSIDYGSSANGLRASNGVRTLFYNASVKTQSGRGDNGSLEFRSFVADPDRLVPAIEFSYAFFKFTSKFTNSVKTPVEDGYVSKENFGRLKNLPTLLDFKKWVENKEGYRVLKKDPAWISL